MAWVLKIHDWHPFLLNLNALIARSSSADTGTSLDGYNAFTCTLIVSYLLELTLWIIIDDYTCAVHRFLKCSTFGNPFPRVAFARGFPYNIKKFNRIFCDICSHQIKFCSLICCQQGYVHSLCCFCGERVFRVIFVSHLSKISRTPVFLDPLGDCFWFSVLSLSWKPRSHV